MLSLQIFPELSIFLRLTPSYHGFSVWEKKRLSVFSDFHDCFAEKKNTNVNGTTRKLCVVFCIYWE